MENAEEKFSWYGFVEDINEVEGTWNTLRHVDQILVVTGGITAQRGRQIKGGFTKILLLLGHMDWTGRGGL